MLTLILNGCDEMVLPSRIFFKWELDTKYSKVSHMDFYITIILKVGNMFDEIWMQY